MINDVWSTPPNPQWYYTMDMSAHEIRFETWLKIDAVSVSGSTGWVDLDRRGG